MQVTVQFTGQESLPEQAKKIYDAGFVAVDGTRRGTPMLQVPANVLIDLMIAYESAREGDTENLEWALAVQASTANKACELLDKIATQCIQNDDTESEIYQLAATHPYSAFIDEHGEEGVRSMGKLSEVKAGQMPDAKIYSAAIKNGVAQVSS